MSASALRREVLRSFKNLHRASSAVFQNNKEALEKAKKEINEAFKKNKNVSNDDSIKELINVANATSWELKISVAELEKTPSGNYRLKLRPEMFEEPNFEPIKKLPES